MSDSNNGRPTIRDVARDAGVSRQTVSRVLNDHPRVAPTTRQRVLRSMKKLGFERNLAAQMLTTQRSQTIQVITVDGKFPFEVPLLDTTHDDGYFAIYSETTSDRLAQVLDRARARLVEGVFLYAPKLHIDDDELLSICRGVSLVRRDFALGSKKVTWVGYDQIRATEMAVQHLIDLGHREIAEVTGTLEAINASLRHETWLRALRANGLQPGPSVAGDYTTTKDATETGYDAMRRLLASGATFTAVMIANDHMAIGALHALRQHGLRIPQDVSVISFDNAPAARFLDPPLTTVDFDFNLQNRLAFQFLFERIQKPDTPPHQHVLLPGLVVRDSTRPLG